MSSNYIASETIQPNSKTLPEKLCEMYAWVGRLIHLCFLIIFNRANIFSLLTCSHIKGSLRCWYQINNNQGYYFEFYFYQNYSQNPFNLYHYYVPRQNHMFHG